MSRTETQRGGSVIGRVLGGAVLLAMLIVALNAWSASSAQAGTLIVTKGGDRNTSSSSVTGSTTYAQNLAGAAFEYSTSATGPWTAIPGTTGANGQVSITLSAGTYYVRERTPAPDFDDFGPVQGLWFGGQTPSASQPYVARVSVTSTGTTYAHPHTNTSSNPSNWTPTNGASGSNNGTPFIDVRNNGTVTNGCGQNILLVLDRSGSIEPYKDAYEAAAREFVNQLNGTPTQIGIISFNNSVNSYQPATGNSNYYRAPLDLSNAGSASSLNATISNIYDSPTSLTNWDGALQAAAQAKSFTNNASTGQTTNPDMVVFITDGNPTTSEVNTSGSNEDLINLTSGIASANLVKNQASRTGKKLKMLAIGVGTGVTADNLKVVSGPVQGVNGDYAVPSIPELQSFLQELAAAQCGARVYVRKRLAGGNENQSGWKYTAVDPRPGFSPSYLDNNNATHSSGMPPVIQTGAFFTNLPTTPTTVQVNENATGQPLTNFDLTSVVCRKGGYDSGQTVNGTQNGLNYSLPVSRGDEIYCTYTNSPKTTLTINKTPDNGTVNAGDDAEFTIAVQNTGTNTAMNAVVSDQLPAPGVGGWTVSQQPAGGSCTVSGSNLLSCNLGDLPAGQTRTIKVKTGTNAANCAVYDNPTARASAANAPEVTNGGKITCQKPNLEVDKTAASGTINAGDDVQFSVTLTNHGPGLAKGATLSDTLPGGTAGGWTIVSQPGGNPCQINGQNLSCSFGDLASGQSRTVTVKAPTNATACTTYDNTATGSATNAASDSDSATVTCQTAGLGVLKTAVQATINAGDNAQFTIVTSNTGQGTAKDVTLSDPLPTAGISGPWTITSQPGGNPCSITAGTLNCDFGDLASGQSRSVTVQAPTNFENCSQLDNLATASSSNTPDASDDATIHCQKPNLSVVKTAAAGTIEAGDDAQFTITASNSGPGTAKGVTLSDPLPSGTAGAWTIVSQPGGNPCQITAGSLTCDFGDLAAGQSRQVVVKASTSYQACTVYDNTATASSTNAPNASDDATVTCRKPALTVTKNAAQGTINAGQDAQFAITLTNNGPGTAKAAKLSDPLPSGTAGAWTIVSQPSGDPCSITGSTLNCDFGDLPAGQSRTVTVKAPTSAAACTTYDNTATGSAGNHPNVTDDATVNCVKPNLSLDKTAASGTINAGDDAQFTVTVSNAGPGTATAVTINDPLPSGTAGAWTIVSQPSGNPCSIAAGTLSCSFGDLAAGQSRTVTVKAPTSYQACGEYDNTVTMTSTNSPTATDNASIACKKPSLTVEKTAASDTVNAGDDVQFSVVTSNAGPGTAKAVTINDPLPGGVLGDWSIVSQPSGDPCSIAAGTLSCDFGDLAAGQSRTVTVKAATGYDSCTVYDNTATASSSNHPDATDSARVSCQKPALATLKTAVSATINAGDDAVFTINVSNAGPGTAEGVTLSDPLPTGVSGPWTIVSQPGGDPCSITAGTLNCDFGDLAAGQSREVTVKAPTNFESCSTLNNVATASADNAPNASDDASINCQKPDLTVEKTAAEGTINAGEDVQFTIVTGNDGPGVAKGVTLSDPLPSGTAGAWTIVSQPGGNPCSITAGTLECDFGDLPASESRSVTVKAATSYEDCTVYDNTATASSTNAPNESDDASVTCNKPGLATLKTAVSATINAGEDAVFTVEVSNTGQGTAKGVTLSDPLPTGVSGPWTITSQPAGDPCSVTAGTLSCDFGDLAGGETREVTVTAPTDFESCTKLDNEATASADNAPDASDDASIDCQKPNLSVVKNGNGAVNAGEDVEFTIQVNNAGPGTAKKVTLSDSLPSGVAGAWAVSSQPAGNPCSITAGVLSCDFGDMTAGTTHEVTVKAATDYESCTTYDNTATASAENAPDASDEDTVTCDRPSTSTLKTAVTGTINAGDDAQFSITVSNGGPGVAKGVTLSDPLPTGVAGAWTIVSQPQGNPCSISGANLTCDFGDLPPEASRTVVVKAATDFENCATLDNTAIASGSNAPDASDSASINCQKPNLQIVKTGNGTISAGQNVAFTITVSNSGPGVAKGVTLSDPLPNGVAGGWTITSQPAGNPCSISGNTLSCDFGDMAAGATNTVAVQAGTSANRCRAYDNTATATAVNSPDVTAGDRVTCLAPNLQLRKRANKKVVRPGEKVRYTIMVRNRKIGSVATNLKICDRIPPKMTVVKRGSGRFENGRLCWTVAKLQGSSKWKRFHYVARVNRNANGGERLRNVVTLGQEKATWTVRVKEPPVQARRRRTPVTG